MLGDGNATGVVLGPECWGIPPHSIDSLGGGERKGLLKRCATPFRQRVCFVRLNSQRDSGNAKQKRDDPHPPACRPNRMFALESVLARDALEGGGTSEAAPAAVRQAVGGGCRSGWGRLLSVTHAIESGALRQKTVAGRRLGALEGGGGSPPPPLQGIRGAGICCLWVVCLLTVTPQWSLRAVV